ncbi:hypothetical protein ACFL6M_04740 [Candidatus Eisenbacteria bacterium]|uniref:Uncharacterized protein n=1 Tax=Eiseniibacteriota bacterium TaxID=2212470 RepID=A0ABV6YL39_UNCEI
MDRSEYRALDWAVEALLQRVRADVIRPMLKRLRDDLPKPADEEGTSHSRNLAAGFLMAESLRALHYSTGETAEAEKPPEDPLLLAYEGKWSGKVRDNMCKLLYEKGHLLFNSYYYMALDAFGERTLVPVVPESAAWEDHYQRAAVPFHLNRGYRESYGTLVMPMRAGISPRLCELFEEDKLKEEDETRLEQNFLGQLSILLKREDYVHGHLSALVGVLSGADSSARSGTKAEGGICSHERNPGCIHTDRPKPLGTHSKRLLVKTGPFVPPC